MRFIMIDRITSFTSGESAEAIKCLSLSNEIFEDHFPGFPTYPGVLLVEGMAQLSAFFLEKSMTPNLGEGTFKHIIMKKIVRMDFIHMATPGDVVQFKVTNRRKDGGYYHTDVSASVEGKLIAEGEIQAYMMPLDSEVLINFKTKLYKQWTSKLRKS